MTNYNLTVFLDIADGEEYATEFKTKLEELIKKNDGKIFNIENHGRVELSNTFKKHTQAYHIQTQYAGSNSTLAALNKEFKINEKVIRTMNVLLRSIKEEADVEKITA